jgi:hypothetical protein
LQCDIVDEPVARLTDRLVRADDVSVGHDERKVPRERTAVGGSRGYDSEFGLGGDLYEKKKKKSKAKQEKTQNLSFSR